MSDRYGFVEHEDALHEKAIAAEGLDDFGETDYLEGLRVLLHAYDEQAKLHVAGSKAVRHQIIHALRQRLRTERWWKEKPELLDHEIRRPIFITGCVRTGSTALHYLMGQDPGIQKLEWWLGANPQPRPPRETWADHPDFQASRAEMDAMFAADPKLKTMHFTTADGPEECRHFLFQCFTDDAFEVGTSVPAYEEWYHSSRYEHTYRRHSKLVRLVGSTDTERRWLLKYPVHLRQLDVLLDVYPDACIVHTHRDPRDILPSYCNMVAGYRGLMERDIDREEIARTQLLSWAQAANRSVEVRRRHDPAQFFDLHFDDYTADPVGAVRRIYAHFDQPLSAEGERALERWNEDNPQHKHGKHEYSAGDTGLAEKEIVNAFAEYLEHFGMLP